MKHYMHNPDRMPFGHVVVAGAYTASRRLAVVHSYLRTSLVYLHELPAGRNTSSTPESWVHLHFNVFHYTP